MKRMQEHPTMWQRVDAILETSQNQQTTIQQTSIFKSGGLAASLCLVLLVFLRLVSYSIRTHKEASSQSFGILVFCCTRQPASGRPAG